jgi:glycosyltransferase involved in cell wall biosynthesis
MRISFFMPSLAGGGAERVVLNLIRGFQRHDIQIDLLVASTDGELLSQIPEGINFVDLKTKRVLRSVFSLAYFLHKNRPDILFSAMDHANLVAIWAAILSANPVKRVISVHQVGTKYREIDIRFREKVVQSLLKIFFRYAHQIVAVSNGVADDLIQKMHIKPEKIKTIGNPILFRDQLNALKDKLPTKPAGLNRIVSVGRLVKEKDFHTLITAFYLVNKRMPGHLLVYGEGPERESLEQQWCQFGLSACVDFPGFTGDVFSAFQAADLCVVSSLTEGFGNVIVEALACGVPVVSTDCPTGPREILQDGKYGILVPVQDPEKMADAMIKALGECVDRKKLQERADDFTIEKITDEYLSLFEKLLGQKSK